jgi:hypothetical protein
MPSGRVAELFLEEAAKLQRNDRFVCFFAGAYASDDREVDALSPVLLLQIRGVWSAAHRRWSRGSRRCDRKLDAK